MLETHADDSKSVAVLYCNIADTVCIGVQAKVETAPDHMAIVRTEASAYTWKLGYFDWPNVRGQLSM